MHEIFQINDKIWIEYVLLEQNCLVYKKKKEKTQTKHCLDSSQLKKIKLLDWTFI